MSLSPCCEHNTLGPIAPRKRPENPKKAEDAFISFSVSVERVRFIAFVCFWIMCLFAMAMAEIFVKPMLAAGPPDGSTCPPFERVRHHFYRHVKYRVLLSRKTSSAFDACSNFRALLNSGCLQAKDSI